MQDQIAIAIKARLVGAEVMSGDYAAAQTDLATRLATDTDSPSGPAVTNGNRGKSVLFPAITFRLNGSMEAMGGIDFGIVADYFADFEIWDNTESGHTIYLINDDLLRLLDERKGAPEFTFATGRHFYMEAMNGGAVTPMYFDNINTWLGLVRFQFYAGAA